MAPLMSCGTNTRRGVAHPRAANPTLLLMAALLSCVLAWATASWADDAATRPSKLLQLTVVDQATNRPISNATVDFDSEPHNGSTKTDDKGQAVIDFTPSHTPWIDVHAPQHADVSVRWYHRRGDVEPVPATYTLALPPGVPLGGKVVDDDQHPVAGAHVVVDLRGEPLADPHQYVNISYRRLTTAADGTWTLDNAPAAFQSVSVGVWDYRYVINDGGHGYFEMANSPDPDALRKQTAVFTLHNGVSVSGVVLGPDGKPVSDARVGFGPDRVASNAVPAQHTKADGKFAFVFKPGTDVVLSAIADGDAPELAKVRAGDNSENVVIHLSRGRLLQGRVVDEAGKPLANAYVWLDTWRGYRTLGDQTLRSDAQGRFEWKQAPADAVYADVESPGLARRSRVPLTAGTDNEVKLHAPLTVDGTVTDAVTGKPIPSFGLIHGMYFGPDQPVSFWIRQIDTEQDGRFHFSPTFPYPGYAVRIQAKGYLPADSRVFTDAEKHVQLDLKLQPTTDWKPKVMLSDGKPAGGAVATLVTAGENPFQFDGQLRPKYEDQDHQHYSAAADGSLDLPPQDGLTKLVVISADGYAEADQDLLKANGTITLQPWARVTGRLMVGHLPAAGQLVAIQPHQTSPEPYNPEAPHVMQDLRATTDAGGHFQFDYVPPGPILVARYVEQGSGAGYIGSCTETQNLEVRPGSTTDVSIGGTGRVVVGRLQAPPELAGRTDWAWNFCQISTKVTPIEPPIPADVKAGTLEQRRAWYASFVKTDAGKKFVADQNHLFQSIQRYPLEIQPDGRFRVEDVAAGDYTLAANVSNLPSGQTCPMGVPAASASTPFTIPPMPDGRDDHPLELPTLALQMIHTINVGDPAPDFAVKKLDGTDLTSVSLHGKFVLLDFWASWCGPCVGETPSLEAAYDAFGSNDRLVMVSLSLDEKLQDAQLYVTHDKLAWTQAFLPGEWESPVVKAYGVQGIPSIWLIGPDGKVVAKDLRGPAIKTALADALGDGSAK